MLGIFVEAGVVRPDRRHHPGRLVVQHQVHAGRRHRQLAVDRRGERVHEVGPARVEQPERAGAMTAEIALGRGSSAAGRRRRRPAPRSGPGRWRARRARDVQRVRRAHQVDRIAAAARGLAADRAVAELVGLRRVRIDGEPHGAAAAGTLEAVRHGGGSGWLGTACYARDSGDGQGCPSSARPGHPGDAGYLWGPSLLGKLPPWTHSSARPTSPRRRAKAIRTGICAPCSPRRSAATPCSGWCCSIMSWRGWPRSSASRWPG